MGVSSALSSKRNADKQALSVPSFLVADLNSTWSSALKVTPGFSLSDVITVPSSG
ncbi:hypothetical protein DPMN_096877 [Dreissena polymorpha]|uniref:Uncharacterized protein n=1 Tax=Dreissena polymorpha TaxID=45954 RepID=A0A9D4R5U6_DREPO|nr:hypothetical protein DPMN_096877 [Dreissena polymorpha]